MNRIVECIPNFSEGRRREVVDQIAAAIAGVDGVAILDRHSDPDHNRSVITFAGEPEAAADAAFEATRVAADRIDLNQHSGQHPRVGATDVIPFVPIAGTDLDDCARVARDVARRIAEDFGIPTYLYGVAAYRQGRRTLETIRKIGFERLRAGASSEGLRPDFGGPALHPSAGATFCGARPALVAFNVLLEGDDVAAARRIARRIRESGGGLRGVKALGLLMESRGAAQVSMNLTDLGATTMPAALEAVREHARALGIGVRETELVGLAPKTAFGGLEPQDLLIQGFRPEQVLENGLKMAGLVL